MTTNDPQAGYVAEQREPLLSDADVSRMCDTGNGMASLEAAMLMRNVRNWYEAKITSGELMVRKTVSLGVNRNRYGGFECPECHSEYPVGCDPFAIGVGEHCCCGARIIE